LPDVKTPWDLSVVAPALDQLAQRKLVSTHTLQAHN